MKAVGAAAGGVALGAGCDDGAEDEGLLPDAAFDPGQAAGEASDAGLDTPADAAPMDAGPDPLPDLEPVRGDGSHPFHYIDTVVLVQMENRSFDHYYGALSLLEGRADVEGLQPGMSNPLRDGTPFEITHLADDYVTHEDPPHGHGASLEQWNNGANDGFLRVYNGPPEHVMGYYVREQLPAHYLLADHFTICNRWHASVLGPTWPNRFFSHCGTSDGATGNGRPIASPTHYPALLEKGLDYKVYFTNLFFTAIITSITDRREARTAQFYEDAAAGTLPNVSIVEPAFFNNDDHPPADVRMGQVFISSVYEALRRSPQWGRCLMVLFYDECGGFHDHVAPPEARGETRPDEGFRHLGFRVPAALAGPLVKRGHVLDTLVEHSSVPRLLADIFGLDHLNERTRLAGDLGEALDVSLAVGANRPAAPIAPTTTVEAATLEHALAADSGQPELLKWMQDMGVPHFDSLPARRARTRENLMWAKRLGVARFLK